MMSEKNYQFTRVPDNYRAIGIIVSLLASDNNYAKQPISLIWSRITTCIELKQYILMTNRHSTLLGFATWGYLTPDDIRAYYHKPMVFTKQGIETGADKHWFCFDVVAPQQGGHELLSYLFTKYGHATAMDNNLYNFTIRDGSI